MTKIGPTCQTLFLFIVQLNEVDCTHSLPVEQLSPRRAPVEATYVNAESSSNLVTIRQMVPPTFIFESQRVDDINPIWYEKLV